MTSARTRPVRCAWRALPVLLAVGLLGTCARPDGPAPLAVASRSFSWTGSGRPGAPLSLHWAGAELLGAWLPGAATARDADRDGTAFRGRHAVILEGPVTAPGVDLSLHQQLVVRFAAEGVETLVVVWGQDETGRLTERSEKLPVVSDGVARDHVVRLRDVRLEERPTVLRSDMLSLQFRGADDAADEVRIAVGSITLVSPYDDPEGAGYAEASLGVAETYRHGVALRAPGWIETTLRADPSGRLLFALASAGTTADLDVRVQVDGVDHGYVCPAAGRWQDVALPLPDRASAGDVTLRFSAGPSADPRAVLLIGSILRLGPVAGRRPDVILYLEDTLRPDHLSLHGSPHRTDPHLAGVAARGAVFTRAFSTSNWTRPAVSSLLSSLIPSAHGNVGTAQRVPEQAELLAEVLADHGYLTVALVTNFHGGAWSGLDQGFDVIAEPGAWDVPAITSTLTSSVLTPTLEELLSRHAGVPLFVYAHSLDPHAPYDPPEELLAALGAADAPADVPAEAPADATASELELRRRDESARYDAEILHNDRELAALDAALERTGRLEDTLLVFASDHGESLGELAPDREDPVWRHHQTLRQVEVSIPLVMRWPREIPAGQRHATPVSLIDAAPTILGLLGLPVPEGWQGVDLAPLLTRSVDAIARPEPIVIDTTYMSRVRELFGVTREIALVAWPYKLTVRVEGAELRASALHDLAADPEELVDRVGDPDLAPVVEGLLGYARTIVERGAAWDESAAATRPDARMEEWLREMGYLY